MSLEQPSTPNELSEVIAESFGPNATYVETLLARFRSDPSLVDDSWRAYFEELLGNGQPATSKATATAGAVSVESTQPQAKPVHADGDGSKAAATQKTATSRAP